MILYTLASPPHERLLTGCFLPSVRRFNEYDVHIEQVASPVPGGVDAPRVLALHRAGLMIRAIEENWGGSFAYADVDVVFLRPTRDWLLAQLEGQDVCTQQGARPGEANIGFMIQRANATMLRLWERLHRWLQEQPDIHAETMFNHLLRPGMLPWWILGRPLLPPNRWLLRMGLAQPVRHRSLPRSVFHLLMAPGFQRPWQRKLPDDLVLDWPAGLRVVHAAYVIGAENKLALLKRALARPAGMNKPGNGAAEDADTQRG